MSSGTAAVLFDIAAGTARLRWRPALARGRVVRGWPRRQWVRLRWHSLELDNRPVMRMTWIQSRCPVSNLN